MRRPGWRSTVHAEWLKLSSLRSFALVLAVAVVMGLGLGLLDLASVVHHWASMTAADRAGFDPVGESFSGFQYSELALGALGVLAITSEYATGTIAVTLTATPQRSRVYAAKALVLGAVILVVAEACAFTAFLSGQRVLATRDLDVGLTDPHVLRAVICAGLYLATVTLVGFGLGAVLRHTAGGMAAMFGLVFLSWPVARAVEGFSHLPDRLLLVNIGDAITATRAAPPGPLADRIPTLGQAGAYLALYLVVFVALGAWRCARDA